MAPSAPWAKGNSKSEAATARAAVQAKREPHLRRHACSTRRRKMWFSHLALARASWVKNDRVSSEKRPPTSTPNTTKRARARLPTNSRYVASWRLRALVTLAPSSTAARVVGRPSLRSAHTKVVSTANWAPLKIGRPSTTVSSRLPSASEPTKPRSRSRNNTLVVTRPPPSRQIRAATLSKAHPRLSRTPTRAHAARWWPKESSGRPHRQVRTVRGKGNWSRRNKVTQKRWASILVTRHVGQHVRTKPAPDPPWERVAATALSVILEKRLSLKAASILEATSCCQLALVCPNSKLSGSNSTGLAPPAKALHEGCSNPLSPPSARTASLAP